MKSLSETADKPLFFVLTSRSKRAVFLLQTDQGWTLPRYDRPAPNNVGFEEAAPFNCWFKKHYGIDVLRRYSVERGDSGVVIFVLEPRDPASPLPFNGHWVSETDLRDSPFASPTDRWLLERCFEGVENNRTMPWSQGGGLDDAIAWMFEQCSRLGFRIEGPVEQVKNAYVSCVIRCRTNAGDVYLKVLPDIFIREIEITRLLADWRIAPVPACLAVNPKRRWMLTRDMSGCNLDQVSDLAVWERVVRELAAFQFHSIRLVKRQSSPPLYDWRVPRMIDAIEPMVDELPALFRDSPHGLTSTELSALRSMVPRRKEQCVDIEGYGVPHALEHGDLRAGNIRITPGGVLFYDWAWSSVAHPFLSITGMLNIHRDWLSSIPGARERLRDAYLERWTAYAPMGLLRELFERVDRWKTLYGAITDAAWVRAILHALDGQLPAPYSADAWTLDRRQYYLAKVLRRLL